MLMQTHEARLSALRQELKARQLDGFVIPISDEHMSEYVGAYAQRLAWLTGFGGSAGSTVVLQDKAAIFIYDERGVRTIDTFSNMFPEAVAAVERLPAAHPGGRARP